jgi:FtsH-binding integral membrane protein
MTCTVVFVAMCMANKDFIAWQKQHIGLFFVLLIFNLAA